MKKKVLFAAAFMLLAVGAYAQGNGIAGITEAVPSRTPSLPRHTRGSSKLNK